MSLIRAAKEIGKDMSIYGVSTLLGQIISFFLLPLYTSYLSPNDYGILAIIGVFTGGYGILSNFGLSSAIFRFTGMTDSEVQKLQYLDTAQYLNLGLNLFFGTLVFIFSGAISVLMFDAIGYDSFLKFGILLGFVGSLASIPLSYLRIRRKTAKIAYSSLLNLLVTVVCTITGLIILKWGIWGALVGNACGNIVSLFFLLVNVKIPKWSNVSYHKTKVLLNYALPMLPHKTFGFLLPMFSQVFLLRYLSLEMLGIYNIAYKFCTPIVIFTNLFQKAYSPYRFEIIRRNELKDSKQKLSRINLFFVVLISIGYSTIVIFGDDLLKYLTQPEFHTAGNFLLYIALIPVAQSLYFSFGTGIEFTESPKFMPVISGIGFGITLLSCFILIPKFGIVGAAISPTLGWLTMAVFVYHYAQGLFKLSYDWQKYLVIILLTLVLQLVIRIIGTNLFVLEFILFLVYIILLFFIFNRELLPIIKNKFVPYIKEL